MANISIRMITPPNTSTTTVGEIFKTPREGAKPEVDDVIVRASRLSRCQLGSGAYTYTFHVEGEGGKFTVEVDGTANPVSPTRVVDTSFGFSGWTFDFTVA